MNDAIIVLNAGSSSLKFSIHQVGDGNPSLVARGQIEGLGATPHFMARDRDGSALADARLQATSTGDPIADACTHLFQWAREQFSGALSPIAVGHRVVHGGLEFAEPTLIDEEVLARLERLVPLAPLHQPHSLTAVKAVAAMRPDLPQVACFDTAFHRSRADVTERFGLPDDLFRRGVRRWGFHGLSYASIIDQLRRTAPTLAMARLIVAHLGNGASMCAIKGGRSVDTTMGFSVLDGLPMGTRCGSLDPGVILFLMQSMDCREIERLLYTQSGLLGISGISNDVRELLASESPLAARAIDFFVYRAMREIASLTAALGGLDGLIFTGGIGENSPVIRTRICQGLAWLGVVLDVSANERGRGCISPGHTPSVWVVPTDEEQVIAAGTLAVLQAGGHASEHEAATLGRAR